MELELICQHRPRGFFPGIKPLCSHGVLDVLVTKANRVSVVVSSSLGVHSLVISLYPASLKVGSDAMPDAAGGERGHRATRTEWRNSQVPLK